MTNSASTIIDDNGEQPHATVKSVLAEAPDDFTVLKAPTADEVREFILDMNTDQDRIEAKRDGATVSEYYHGRLQMQKLEEHLAIEFPETWQSKFKITENFTKSTAKQLSTIYKKKPKREAANKRNSNMTEDQLKDQTEVIDFIYKRGRINRSFQEIERFAKWAKSVLIKISYNPQTTKIKLKPYSPQFYDVMVSEGGVLRAVIISDYMSGGVSADDNAKRNYYAYTADEIITYRGAKVAQTASKPNELGIIPFVFFNDDLPVENEKPYLHADTMMSNANLAINRTLTDAMSLIKNKTYGQPYIIGGDIDNIPSVTGHEDIWHIPQGDNDTTAPVVGMLVPSGDLESILVMVERVANGYATSRGLAPDSFTAVKTGGGTSSGIALKIKNHVLLEMRDSEEEKYDELEDEVFEIVKTFHNFYAEVADGGHDMPKIEDGIKVSVHFDDNSLAFENPVEVRKQQLTEVSQGLMKRSEFIRLQRPYMSEEEAIIYLEAVADENNKLGVVPSLEDLDKIITNNGDDDNEAE